MKANVRSVGLVTLNHATVNHLYNHILAESSNIKNETLDYYRPTGLYKRSFVVRSLFENAY